MSVKDLYWRELEFDNSKRYSWVFHNYAVIINAEVLIHIAKADAPAPNNDSPYFTIPFSSLEYYIREDLNKIATRAMVILDPLKVIITN